MKRDDRLIEQQKRAFLMRYIRAMRKGYSDSGDDIKRDCKKFFKQFDIEVKDSYFDNADIWGLTEGHEFIEEPQDDLATGDYRVLVII